MSWWGSSTGADGAAWPSNHARRCLPRAVRLGCALPGGVSLATSAHLLPRTTNLSLLLPARFRQAMVV